MSSRVSPASSIAARHASMVSSMGSRIRRRPTSDIPMPVILTSCSNFFITSRGLVGVG